MLTTPRKRERIPILEDDDPFAVRRLSKTWFARSVVPQSLRNRQEQQLLPISPPPFSSLLPFHSQGSPRKSSLSHSEVPVSIEEPVTPRKPDPTTKRHPQYHEFSSNATSSAISDESALFNAAPFPPLRRDNTQAVPTSILRRITSVARQNSVSKTARFTEMVNSSPNRSLLPLSSLPSLLLERTSDGALFPGSTFSFAISLPSFRPPSSPLSVELTFTGSTARYGSAPSTEHLLFRLSSSIDLKASKWNGVITILLSSTCCTCHTRNDVLPQSFSHREADGRKYETSYVIVANCEEFEEARLEIEVGSRSQGSERRDEGTATGSEVEGFIEGWQLDLTHSEMRFRYDLDDSKSTPDFSPYPVLRISSKFRFLSTANEPDYETLLLAFSPAQFSVFPQALIHSSRSAEVSRTRMVFSNRLDDFELTVRSLNLEEHQAVEVLREWVIDAEAMDLAPFTSCAGFSVSFELTVELGRTSSSAGLRFGVPFASSSPSPPSSRAQTGLTDAASTNTSVDTGDLSGVGGAGDVVTEAEIAERESGKNAARRRWNRLRRIFLATKAISGRS